MPSAWISIELSQTKSMIRWKNDKVSSYARFSFCFEMVSVGIAFRSSFQQDCKVLTPSQTIENDDYNVLWCPDYGNLFQVIKMHSSSHQFAHCARHRVKIGLDYDSIIDEKCNVLIAFMWLLHVLIKPRLVFVLHFIKFCVFYWQSDNIYCEGFFFGFLNKSFLFVPQNSQQIHLSEKFSFKKKREKFPLKTAMKRSRLFLLGV